MSDFRKLVLIFLLSPALGVAQDGRDPFPQAGAVPMLVGPGIISTGDDEAHATLSLDGRTLYFVKGAPSFDFWALAASEWSGGNWQRPQVLPFSGQYSDADLVFAPDGYAYFVSSRPVNGVARTDTEIWRIAFDAAGWGEPQHVAQLGSPGDEWFPTFTTDGVVYFGSSREGGQGSQGGHDIWRSRLVDGGFEKPENVGAPVNTPGEEIEAFVTPDGNGLIVAAKNRGDELGAYDLYLSRRCEDGNWSEPRNPGEPVNSYAWEFGPRMSPDGKFVFFTSNRGFAGKPLERALDFNELEQRIRKPYNGLRDIYVMDAAALWQSVAGECAGR